jgi:hypothetical protein
VFFRPDGWVAYSAHREGDQFRFSAQLQQGRDSDQGFGGPNSATIIGGGRLALRT